MSLSEKDIFYSLLHNHKTNLKELCDKCGVSYPKVSKRALRGALLTLPTVDAVQLCKGLGVSYEDFSILLRKAKNGEFPDDYPKNQIKLNIIDRSCLEDRIFPMMLTAEEKELIEQHRNAVQKALKRQAER